jgi:hypothetical protein
LEHVWCNPALKEVLYPDTTCLIAAEAVLKIILFKKILHMRTGMYRTGTALLTSHRFLVQPWLFREAFGPVRGGSNSGKKQ